MKKIILGLNILAIAAATTFVACKKDEVKTTKSSQKSSIASLSRGGKTFIPLFGDIGITVSWKDGCYSSTTLWYPNGAIQSQTIRCEPGCSFCMVTGTVVGSVSSLVTGDGLNDPHGLNVSYSNNTGEYFGIIGKGKAENSLVFAIDKTKISNEIYQAKFAGNTIDLSSGFAIDENTFNALGIDRALQFIPAGNYPLYEDGNIVFFEYSLD